MKLIDVALQPKLLVCARAAIPNEQDSTAPVLHMPRMADVKDEPLRM